MPEKSSPIPYTIRVARLGVGLTQREAGAMVGAPSARTWQDWERGIRKMPRAKWELFLLKSRIVTEISSL